MRCSKAMSPPRLWPKRNSGPIQTSRAQALHQAALHEILGTEAGQLAVEAQQADALGTEIAQAFELGARQGQPRRRAMRGEEFARQRLEAHRHRRHAQGLGARQRMAHQRAMAQVQAVEGADADHASVRVQRPALDVSE